jgi:peptidyl-prolyl cis-trans isomerase B (cyclophilin B)
VPGKRERQRRLARERYERQQARRAERMRRRRHVAAIGGAVAAVVALAVGGYFLFAPGGGKTSAAASSHTPSASPSAAPSPAGTVQASGPASRCTYTPGGTAARNVGAPPATPAAALVNGTARYQATIHTNRGDIAVSLAAGKATCTVNSFVHLAQKSFFSNTKCHRLVTAGIYVLQCGDPTGSGSGGPGYAFANEVKGDSTTGSATYPAGTLAMAHSSQPNSNGSQFFLVYQATPLPPDYTPFGTITNGLDIVKNVAKAGTDNANGSGDGHPKESVVIESVSVTP